MNGKKSGSDLLVQLAPIALIGFIGFKLYDKFFGDPNADKVKLTVDQVKTEIQKKEDAGELPTFTQTQYNTFADTLSAAMEGMGTDETTIYRVMAKMTTLLDVMKLVSAFGVRTYHEFLWIEEQYNLGQWFQNELGASEMKKLNKILSDKKINFQF